MDSASDDRTKDFMAVVQTNVRVLADFASAAIWFRLMDAGCAVAWADEQIAEYREPLAKWLIDLATVDRTDAMAVLAALDVVPGFSSRNESIELLNTLILREWQEGRLSIGRVREIGWTLYIEERDQRQWSLVVESAGEVMDAGMLSQEAMPDAIVRELNQYESFIELLPAWAHPAATPTAALASGSSKPIRRVNSRSASAGLRQAGSRSAYARGHVTRICPRLCACIHTVPCNHAFHRAQRFRGALLRHDRCLAIRTSYIAYLKICIWSKKNKQQVRIFLWNCNVRYGRARNNFCVDMSEVLGC